MRKLMWFTVGFAAACTYCAYFWVTEDLILPAVILGIASLLILYGAGGMKWLRCAAVACLGCAVGFGWFQVYSDSYISFAARLDEQIENVTARCTDYGYQTDYGTAVEGFLTLEGKPYRAKFYVSGAIDMEPGDVLKGPFEFRLTTPDRSDSSYHQGEGIFLLAYQEEDAELLKLVDSPAWAFPSQLRKSLTGILDSYLPEDTAGFAKALLLGDRTGLDYETNTDFKISGIMHVIAVSGLHVSILFSLVYVACFKQRWLVALIGIPVMVLFAAVAGFSPSVVRAAIMMILMMLAMLFNREYDGPTELAFSCLAMLFINPMVITSISFQLSVGCMIGIFLFQKRIFDWMIEKLGKHSGKIRRWFSSSVSVTLSAMTLTTPLTAYYFGTVSLVGIVTNLLTLWIINFIFYGLMLLCLVGWEWAAAGALLGKIISWPIRYVLWVSDLLAAFPLAALYTRSIYIVAWLVFCYVLLVIFLFSRKKRPAILFSCAALSLCLCLGVSWIEPLTDDCRMTVLNVGQGQSIILQSEGKTYLVDCGGSYDEDAANLAAETLMSQGIFRLDGIIVTHFDRDHAGGLPYLLTRMPADALFMPQCEDEEGVGAVLEQLAGNGFYVSEDLILSYGDTDLTIFAPVVPDSGNESSLAVLFRAGNCDILITGDRSEFGERILLKTARLPELEILVAGHHGAKSSTCAELLEATNPKLAVISVGENHYGHPSQEVLDRLEAIGCTVYRTDLDGNIAFRR